jgi:hypothetical protein
MTFPTFFKRSSIKVIGQSENHCNIVRRTTLLNLNNFPKFERASKISHAHWNFFFAISGALLIGMKAIYELYDLFIFIVL